MESMASKTFCVRIVTIFSLLMGVVILFVIESLLRAVVNPLSKLSSDIMDLQIKLLIMTI